MNLKFWEQRYKGEENRAMDSKISNECKDKIILFILSFCAFFSNLYVKSADIMEARNFVTAREIIENGNWLIPTMNGVYRFEKPPLPT